MSLLRMSHMTTAEREARRELDESCFRRVHVEIERGYSRSKAFDRVAYRLFLTRGDVVAAYWRHHRRSGCHEVTIIRRRMGTQ